MQSIVIYTQDGCGACQEVKQLLTSNDIAFEEKVVALDITKAEVLKMYPTARQVPLIVIDGVLTPYHEMKTQLLLG